MKYEELEKLLNKIDAKIKESEERQKVMEKASLDIIVEKGIERGLMIAKLQIIDFFEENKKN